MNESPVAFVTGASRGIGRGIAIELARNGFSVGINYANNRDAAEETRTACEEAARAAASFDAAGGAGGSTGGPSGSGTGASGGTGSAGPGPAGGAQPGSSEGAGAGSAPAGAQRFEVIQGNVGSREDRERMLNEVFGAFGRIDALVNNAGIPPRVRNDILEATEEHFEEVMRVNVHGPYFLTQAVARHWVHDKPTPRIPTGFKIVFIGSISADTVSLNRGEYCVSKAGGTMATKLWAVRLATENVQVYEVRPGITATDMTAGVKDKYDRLIGEGLVPQGRWGTAEDNGKAVASLCRGDFAFSTGEVINVDGAFHISRL